MRAVDAQFAGDVMTDLNRQLIALRAENERLRANADRKDVALHRALKFIRLGNHPNADDLIEQINCALGRID